MTSTADRLSVALADRYRIERELGAGGMATVYLAHDLRHERDVAIKVLHPDLAAALGGERFLSEIKTTARLQHPHILPLLDSGAADGLLFYVMPYVSGETLRARLERERQLPLEDALRIAREVADALSAAHALGIIHRDIKPENILLQGGHAMVADFGIALAVQSAGGARMTQTGLSLGTPQYMSPEQAMGERTIDARTDQYALGAVTYEMLGGEPPFTGPTVQAIIAKALSERPVPLHTLRDTVPYGVEQAVLTALAKLPADRFATVAEFATALAADRQAPTGGVPSDYARGRALQHDLTRARRINIALGAVALVAVVAGLWASRRNSSATPAAVTRFELTTADGLRARFGVPLALSPNGDRAVTAVVQGSGYSLAVRKLGELTAQVLPGTEGAIYPEFSPDGRWISFESAAGMLQRIAPDGSSLTTISQMSGLGSGGTTWISNDEIIFSPRTAIGSGMFRVPAAGGEAKVFTTSDSSLGERFQLAPRAADGGRLVFYSSTKATATNMAIAVARVSDHTTRIFPELRGGRVLGLIGGQLVFVRFDGALMAAPFDVHSLTVGAPVQLGVGIALKGWDAYAALSSDGSLLYEAGGSAGRLVQLDLGGGERMLVDSVRSYSHPRFSPDGRQLAFEVTSSGGTDVNIVDLAGRTLDRITIGGVNDRPEWTPDGTRLMYTSARGARTGLWWQPVDRSAPASLIYETSDPIREGVFTPDGRAVVFRTDAAGTNRDIWLLPLTGERKATPLLVTELDDKQPRVSPDSRLLAYVSNESGREEVYLRALAAGGGRIAVSAGGGGEPLWSRDGRRLYYREGDRVLEASLSTVPTLAVTGRRVLFAGPYMTDGFHANYDLAPDGRSFVMIKPANDDRRLVMVTNWVQELRQRTAGAK